MLPPRTYLPLICISSPVYIFMNTSSLLFHTFMHVMKPVKNEMRGNQ